jgi:large subunit ribosomal protein L14e
MSLYEIGRLCLKIAGRDAGRKCVVVEQVDQNFVVVDGDVRRKKINIKHLEPLTETIELKEGATHDEVKSAFTTLKLSTWERKSKPATERPKKQRKVKVKETKKPVKEAKKEKVVKETSEEKKE